MFNTNSVDKEHVVLLTKLQRKRRGGEEACRVRVD